jgi:1,4-alpha-glucan branching enzyme
MAGKTELAQTLRKAPAKVRVPFTVKVAAKQVVLTGEFTQWAKDKVILSPKGSGEWHAELQLPPGEYRYRLLVDGEWRDHAEAAKRVPNPYGSEDCVLIVS